MKTIRINFVDFWKNFNPENSAIYNRLKKKWQVVISSEPDYLFYSCYGYEHLKYDCIRIFFTGENIVPDFNICDYAIGFHDLNLGDRYRRIPLYSFRKNYTGLAAKKVIDREKLLNRKFCNFLYSNKVNAHPVRKKFFDQLNEYKKVDSGGGYLNNLGYRVADKTSFLSEYKFTLAFENSTTEGYTTEKLIDPMSVHSMPVYWGNPKVGRDFNTSSFIHLKDASGPQILNAIERIIYLDQNDASYLEAMEEPWLYPEQVIHSDNLYDDFLSQILTHSVSQAKRRAEYGFNGVYTNRLKNYIYKPSPGTKILKRITAFSKKILARISS